MIQPLRTVHRRAFVALAFVLPAILAVGLGARRPRPQLTPLAAQIPASARLLKTSDTLWQRHAIKTEFYGDSNNPQEVYLVLNPRGDLNEPDLLLYWSGDQPSGGTLPPEAHLLGAFPSNRAFVLPRGAGYIILYSLAHKGIVDTAAVEKLL